jgi:hypothetical protein
LSQVAQPLGAASRKRDLGRRKLGGGVGVAKDAHRLLGAGDFRTAAGGIDVDLAQL